MTLCMLHDVLVPRNENTKGAERQLKYFVYSLEAACRAADDAGQSCCCLLP